MEDDDDSGFVGLPGRVLESEWDDEEEEEEEEEGMENVFASGAQGYVTGQRPAEALDSEWDDDDEDEWDDEDEEAAGFRFEDVSGGADEAPPAMEGGAFDGMDEPSLLDDPEPSLGSVFEGMDDVVDGAGKVPSSRTGPKSAQEMSLLYDDFELVKKNKPRSERKAEVLEKKQKFKEEIKRKGRSLDKLEEREYVVTAEGIAVRTLPDERSPRTGEILRQGETFTAIEAVDGEGLDQRLYLKLENGRGWVFDDEKIFPGLPSVKLIAIGGEKLEEDKPEMITRPIIAVIGRPNVGKSTLVNKICDVPDSAGSIAWDEPGVTRDRAYKQGEHTDDCGDTYMFEMVDTGGLVFYDNLKYVTFEREIKTQIDIALNEAVAAIFCVDANVGLVGEDMDVAKYLHENYVSRGLRVIVAVCKCDRLEMMDYHCAEFWSLGFGEPMPVCCLHGRGVWEVADTIINRGCNGLFPMKVRGEDPPPSLRDMATSVAILGKPNAGKSSLLNALVGDARCVVSDKAGTTTDSIDAYLQTNQGKVYRFIDTAGVRRKGKIEPGTEWLSVNRSIKAVKRADVVLLLLDASQVMTGSKKLGYAYWSPDQQMRYLARQVEEKGTACIIVLSKWDAVPEKNNKTQKKFVESIRANLAGVGQWAEIVTCSALTGQRLKGILEQVDKTVEAHRKRVPTPILNEVVRDCLLWRLPAAKSYNKKHGRIYYATQVSTEPPTIALFCNNPKLFSENYKTYLENKLRQDLAWWGTPLQLEWRKRSERKALQQADEWLQPRLAPEEVWR